MAGFVCDQRGRHIQEFCRVVECKCACLVHFFYPFGYNYIACKTHADRGNFICVCNTEKDDKIHIWCPPIAEMTLENLAYPTLQ